MWGCRQRLSNASPSATASPPIQACQDRRCLLARARATTCLATCARVWSFPAGPESPEEAVASGIAQDHFERRSISSRRPRRREYPRDCRGSNAAGSSASRLPSFPARAGKFAAAAQQCIRGQHAGSAGVGHNRQARASRTGLLAEHVRHFEQLGNAVDAQNAAAAESRVQNFVAAGQRAGMRSGGFGGGFRPARLDDDDGLGAGHLARRGKKDRGSPIDSM